jgi:hypothetical protein
LAAVIMPSMPAGLPPFLAAASLDPVGLAGLAPAEGFAPAALFAPLAAAAAGFLAAVSMPSMPAGLLAAADLLVLPAAGAFLVRPSEAEVFAFFTLSATAFCSAFCLATSLRISPFSSSVNVCPGS